MPFLLVVGSLMLDVFPSLLAIVVGTSFEVEPLFVGYGATAPPPLPVSLPKEVLQENVVYSSREGDCCIH